MLALIAGQGKLPAVLADHLHESPYVIALEGYEPETLIPNRRFRIEHFGTLIADLKALGVSKVCFAGAIGRPRIVAAEIDKATLPLVPRMMAALEKGDDGALRTVINIFEEAGFAVVAADEIASALLPVAAVHTARRTNNNHRADAQRAADVMAGLGPLDVGQSCAVAHGQVLSIEGTFGTDWMLNSLSNRPDAGGGIFFKAKKLNQDRRIDLPVIGVDTVAGVAKAGLDGLVVEESGVMVLNLSEVVRACDELGLFLWVRER